MKVLLHQFVPMATPMSQPQRLMIGLRAALISEGVDADFFRWYDGDQTGDIMHFWGRIPSGLVRLAHQKNLRVVFTENLWKHRHESEWKRCARRMLVSCGSKMLPYQILTNFDWQSYRIAEGCVVRSEQEKQFIVDVFGANPAKVRVIQMGDEPDESGNVFISEEKIFSAARELKSFYEALLKTSR